MDSVGGFTRLEDQPQSNSRWGHDVHVKGGREKRSRPDRKKSLPGDEDDQISLEEMVPQRGIKVKSEIVITTSEWEYKDRLFRARIMGFGWGHFCGSFRYMVYPRRPRDDGPGAQNGAETHSRIRMQICLYIYIL